MQERVIGLDLSLTGSAYAILEEDGELVDYGLISSSYRDIKRLAEIENRIQTLMERHSPILVGIEGYAYAAPNRAHQVGELGGVIRMLLARMRIPMLIIPPSSAKKFITGKGTAPKDMMRLSVYKRWGVEMDSNDEIDAYGIARVALAYHLGDATIPQFQREVLSALKGAAI